MRLPLPGPVAPSKRMTQHSSEQLMTVADICAELRVARATVYGWWATGRGPGRFRLPNGAVRVRREVFTAWLARLEREAA